MNPDEEKVGAGGTADSELPDVETELQQAVAPNLSRELRRLVILLAAGLAVFLLLYLTPVGGIVRDVQALRDFLRGDDLWAEATYAAAVMVLVAIGVPRLTFYVLGGLAFGAWQGLLVAQIGALSGSFLTFLAIRSGGRGWLKSRFGEHRFVGKAFRVRSSIKSVVLIRQLPLNSVVITGGLALSEVSARVFVAGTFIGFLPQGVVATLIGSGIVDEKAMAGFAQLAMAAGVLAVAAWLLWRRRRSTPRMER